MSIIQIREQRINLRDAARLMLSDDEADEVKLARMFDRAFTLSGPVGAVVESADGVVWRSLAGLCRRLGREVRALVLEELQVPAEPSPVATARRPGRRG